MYIEFVIMKTQLADANHYIFKVPIYIITGVDSISIILNSTINIDFLNVIPINVCVQLIFVLQRVCSILHMMWQIFFLELVKMDL